MHPRLVKATSSAIMIAFILEMFFRKESQPQITVQISRLTKDNKL